MLLQGSAFFLPISHLALKPRDHNRKLQEDEERKQAKDLMAAADSAEEAWQRAATLTAAATFTLFDAVRVLVIAVAQR